ncbi:hypothetical protein CDAR_436521 [Caerostris darwini]|uniref:Ycf15 n=1 Tax=Caerostris darwini TaxID=1538125 RepID=A0AAV4R7W5_9ARAC|nr:hypothetical protein CDAR_436521 [Caerostris darwini]
MAHEDCLGRLPVPLISRHGWRDIMNWGRGIPEISYKIPGLLINEDLLSFEESRISQWLPIRATCTRVSFVSILLEPNRNKYDNGGTHYLIRSP